MAVETSVLTDTEDVATDATAPVAGKRKLLFLRNGKAITGLAILGWEIGLALIVASIASYRMKFNIIDYLTQCFDVRSLLKDIQRAAGKLAGSVVRSSQPAKSL